MSKTHAPKWALESGLEQIEISLLRPFDVVLAYGTANLEIPKRAVKDIHPRIAPNGESTGAGHSHNV